MLEKRMGIETADGISHFSLLYPLSSLLFCPE